MILAENIIAFSLLAKSQQIVANVLFMRKDYEKSFDAAADACVYITRLDPDKVDGSPAKRDAYYSNMVDWLEEMILRLPTHKLAKDKVHILIKRWQSEKSGEYRLAISYPGFIPRMRDLAQNYPVLKIEV